MARASRQRDAPRGHIWGDDVVLGKTIIHGVYVLCYLSRQERGTVVSSEAVAQAVGVPAEHARKILQSLGSAGLVASVRGRAGGFLLSRELEQVSVLEVLEAVRPLVAQDGLRPRLCPVAPGHTCRVQAGLVDLHDGIRELLGARTLASLVGRGHCGETVPAAADTDGEFDELDRVVAAVS